VLYGVKLVIFIKSLFFSPSVFSVPFQCKPEEEASSAGEQLASNTVY
jgi:hypothetical protein